MLDYLVEVFLLVIVLVFFSACSIRKKALDLWGVIIANLVGITIFQLGGFSYFIIAVLFFVVAEASTRLSSSKKNGRHERRTIGNIFGNSGVAVIALAMGLPVGFFGAMAAALADTLSSEIGMLSKRKPVLITTFKEVEHGTDGGITPLGMWSSLFGGAIIGLLHFLLNANVYIFLVLIVAGTFGSLVDSFFGAVFERNKILGNTEVNFLGSGAGAILALILSILYL